MNPMTLDCTEVGGARAPTVTNYTPGYLLSEFNLGRDSIALKPSADRPQMPTENGPCLLHSKPANAPKGTA